LNLVRETAPDFSDPLAMLRACHGRMLDLCELLQRLPAWIETHGVDDEAQQAITRIRRYFETAAPQHHADEEDDLFPLLQTDPELALLIDHLRREHLALDRQWQRLAAVFDEIKDGMADRRSLQSTANAFCTAYRDHIEIENTRLLPAAASLLSPDQCVELGRRMAARRHIAT